ncbi:MAG: leucyl/phenylalanyl-tRNA--protein transferase [Gammaproteobacteria bacterium]|nr:leucyl/phenylalanyl-tRNA--protein transferase [Luminiphilus sp.]NCG07277.1 leucyl/phenylalanyl-tRNA--protein transferase [Gammaproteobacteria bacterium]
MDPFPPTSAALEDPNGLLAVGGDLSAARLLAAYQRGIFPWYEAGEPILWWTPQPRAVLRPREFHESKSLRKFLKTRDWRVEYDQRFEQVIEACAAPSPGREETWISDDMKAAYLELHRLGYAHSVEVLDNDCLVGGLYGVKLGKIFFGESMFSNTPNASKVALKALCELGSLGGLSLIDCQMPNEHLSSLGMTLIQRENFEMELKTGITVGDIGHAPTLTSDLVSSPLDVQLRAVREQT